MPDPHSSSPDIRELVIDRIGGSERERASDFLAVEEPLEIRLELGEEGSRHRQSISITMRTPGDDFELAAGFLLSEGLVGSREQIRSIRHCGIPEGARSSNVVLVDLAPAVKVDVGRLQRHFYTTSSCGVCGKGSIEALQVGTPSPLPLSGSGIRRDVIQSLPAALAAAQRNFARTGGLHAAGLFDLDGSLLELREDVGRHNAVDKVIGGELLAGRLPLSDRVLMLSGRVSFELVQKALIASIPIVVAVGAPSSLAIETARAFRMTVVGFTREDRFNLYSAEERIL